MRHPILVGLCVTVGLAWAADMAAAQPAAAEPPRDAVVLGALPRSPGVFRDDITIVKQQVQAGRWKCTVYYRESVGLPGGRVPLGMRKVELVFFEEVFDLQRGA